jgi:hypothetical protein
MVDGFGEVLRPTLALRSIISPQPRPELKYPATKGYISGHDSAAEDLLGEYVHYWRPKPTQKYEHICATSLHNPVAGLVKPPLVE